MDEEIYRLRYTTLSECEISNREIFQREMFFKINVPGARRITINAVRDLRKTIYLKSQSGGRKMVLIFDAHLLSEGMGESANALLKILEEPPKNTSFILVSDKKLALLPTIISRCQPMNFSALNLDQTRQLRSRFIFPFVIGYDCVDSNQTTRVNLAEKGRSGDYSRFTLNWQFWNPLVNRLSLHLTGNLVAKPPKWLSCR